MTTERPSPRDSRLVSGVNVLITAFLAVAAFFLWTEHRAHLLGALPYLLLLGLLLGCVFMHLFMHKGHGRGSDEDRHSDRDRP